MIVSTGGGAVAASLKTDLCAVCAMLALWKVEFSRKMDSLLTHNKIIVCWF